MDDLVKRLRGPKRRPTRNVQLGNGTTITSFGLGYSDHDDELHVEAAAAIEARDAMLRECVKALRELLAALQHFAAPATPKMMIEKMKIPDIRAEICRDIGLQWEDLSERERSIITDCTYVAHRLANTPAQTVAKEHPDGP